MEENNSKHKCNDCAYYAAHYVKSDNRLSEVGGHCMHSKLFSKRINKNLQDVCDCKCWEPVKIRKNKRKQSIIWQIKEMRRHLADIALILKSDAEQ